MSQTPAAVEAAQIEISGSVAAKPLTPSRFETENGFQMDRQSSSDKNNNNIINNNNINNINDNNDNNDNNNINNINDNNNINNINDNGAIPSKAECAMNTIAMLQAREGEVEFSEYDTVVILAFELPVKVVKKSQPEKGEPGFDVVANNTLVLPGLHKIRNNFKCKLRFVGYAGYLTDDEKEKDEIIDLLEDHCCTPVFPERNLFFEYLSFCQGYLWPLFHNCVFIESASQPPFQPELWAIYQSMNKLWATTAVMQYNGDNDLIWVHDYQLMLAPPYIVRKNMRANIGFFLHIPFPSSEVFRCLPVREEILRGLLCADLMGFHFFEYARHFLVSAKRLLGIDHHFRIGGFLGLEYSGRNIMVKVGHVNIQFDELKKEIEESAHVAEMAAAVRKTNPDVFLCASVDRCERLSGLIQKMKGFRLFLRTYGYAQGKVKLIQHVYTTRSKGEDTAKLINELIETAADINREFDYADRSEPFKHIELHIGAISRWEKCALFQAADCLFDASIRDGLNLNAFEYICCRGDAASSLILSEFTGCSRTLASAFRVNPWKLESISTMLDKVMTTSMEELRDRFTRDKLYLSKNSLYNWATDFLADLRRSKKTDNKVYLQWGFASTFRVLSLAENFVYLDVSSVVQAYKNSKVRAIFFDHEGTLAPDRRMFTTVPGSESLSANGTAPSATVKNCLRSLLRDPCNVVVILSGRDKGLLDEWFGDIEGIGLCAEHGFYGKVPSITGPEWECMSPDEDFTWKTIAMELMRLYTKRTQGSFIENKGSALVFQYREADPDFGSWQAKELATYLAEFMFSYPVSLMSGKGYVEVKLRGVNKGHAVEHIIKEITNLSGPVDFALCVGDDRSDEDMFKVVNCLMGSNGSQDFSARTGQLERIGSATESLSGKRPASRTLSNRTPNSGLFERQESLGQKILMHSGSLKEANSSQFFTVTVGKKPSNATHFLNDPDGVSELLENLKVAADIAAKGAVKSLDFIVGENNNNTAGDTTPSRVKRSLYSNDMPRHPCGSPLAHSSSGECEDLNGFWFQTKPQTDAKTVAEFLQSSL